MSNENVENISQEDQPVRKIIPNNPKHPRHEFAISCAHVIVDDPITKKGMISYDQSMLMANLKNS